MYCSACGNQNDTAVAFCGYCGTSMSGATNVSGYGQQPPVPTYVQSAYQQTKKANTKVIAIVASAAAAVIVVVILIIALGGGPLSGTYVDSEGFSSIRFSGNSFVAYMYGREVGRGTYTLDGDRITLNYDGAGAYMFLSNAVLDISRDEIYLDGFGTLRKR